MWRHEKGKRKRKIDKNDKSVMFRAFVCVQKSSKCDDSLTMEIDNKLKDQDSSRADQRKERFPIFRIYQTEST